MTTTAIAECICGKHMLEPQNEGTCLWCGYGRVHAIVEHAYRRNMEHNAHAALDATEAARFARERPGRWSDDACVNAYRAWTAHHGRPPSSTDWSEPQALDPVARPSFMLIHRRFGGWGAFLHYIADVPRDHAQAA